MVFHFKYFTYLIMVIILVIIKRLLFDFSKKVAVYNANVERKVELNIKSFVLSWQEAPSAAKIQKVIHVTTNETT